VVVPSHWRGVLLVVALSTDAITPYGKRPGCLSVGAPHGARGGTSQDRGIIDGTRAEIRQPEPGEGDQSDRRLPVLRTDWRQTTPAAPGLPGRCLQPEAHLIVSVGALIAAGGPN